MSSKPRFRLSAIAIALFAAASFASCNRSHCESLRDELFADKLRWQACDTDFDCILIGGNTKDCTGILSCNLGVNRKYRDEADRRIASLPEDTVDCIECNSPNCESGDITICEPVSHQCIIVAQLLDGGTANNGFVTPDSGGVTPPDFGAGGSP